MKNILVVDDTDSWRQLSNEILSRAGYQVTEAESGKIALQLARASPPDLILTDLDMPDLNGIETARCLRALSGCDSVPIILLTTEEMDGDCDDPPAPYINGYIDKKYTAAKLLDCVEQHLQRA